ncbi:CHAT domain-containing protein [Paraburkholderia guartelaensis]|uniref:CHAT domain-containing protein n=1 Tax=Paraburkholderia guartelaensis TaxID=2546446 RepID=A0A4V6PIP5_9BURK|nr:CHAT domain-containing protein [Paraburkholderia guartelaensis]TDG03890.1 CHAT domain-containing protein [Paraburkholderia guartelaensis]
MRVTVCVERAAGAWIVNAQGPGIAWERRMLQQDDGDGGLLPFPDAESHAAGEPACEGLSSQTPGDVREVYREIVERSPKHIVDYGRYLFDNLVGAVHWSQMLDVAQASQASLVELALKWDANESNLSRLHWEMMHNGSNFLVASTQRDSGRIDVALTRVVKDSDSDAKPLSALPRVLFAVGTSYSDPSIRPGAEIMGILRDAGTDCPFYPYVLENASPEVLQKHIAAFGPEVVHFICHGDLDLGTNAGFIELKPDAHNPMSHFFASQIWQWLNVNGKPPQIVVLSSCKTGASVGSALGPEAVAPLAAQLVREGVPVVVAMSGSISDLACRLFTRGFGHALVRSGETLVAATTKGRRAAIAQGDAPLRSVDWGFPTVYLSAAVQPDYRPAVAAATGKLPTIAKRLPPYLLRRERIPVFCGRTEFFRLFDELFSEPERGVVLAAYARDSNNAEGSDKGCGRTRLLEELVIQTLRHQHVPCAMLAGAPTYKAPGSTMEIAWRINEAMETARQSIGLETGNEGPLVQLKYYHHQQMALNELDARLAKALRIGWTGTAGDPQISPAAIAEAIRMEFAALMHEARREGLASDASRCVLLLDDVQDYFREFDAIARTVKLGAYGFGTKEEPVPVVISFRLGTPADDLLKPVVEGQRAYWRVSRVGAFVRGEKGWSEDMYAYARVLLNPFDGNLAAGISDQAWVMDYDTDAPTVEKWEGLYRKWLNGLPREFLTDKFFMLADMASKENFLKRATDSDEMKKLQLQTGSTP